MAERQWEIEIRAAPEVIYDLVSSIDRVPEFSPECRKTEWIGEPREPVLGARFRGRNRWLGFAWWREVQITRAERGREFGFETVPARGIYHDMTKWRYRFEPTEAGTRVTESYDFTAPTWLRWMDTVMGRPWALARNVRRSLATLKAQAEAEASSTPARLAAT